MCGKEDSEMKKADKAVLKKWISMSAIVFAVAYSLNCFLISPLTTIISNNVVFSETVVPRLLEFLGGLIELIAISFCYATLLMSIYKWETQGVSKVFVTFTVATFLKYLVTVVIGWVDEGSVPLMWLLDLVYVLFYTLLELVPLFIIYKICSRIIIKYTDEHNFIKKIADKGGAEMPRQAYLFDKVYDKKNCLLRSAYVCAIVTLISKLAGRALSDIMIIIDSGLPNEPITLLKMLIAYISMVIFGVMCYMFVYYSISLLSTKLKEN